MKEIIIVAENITENELLRTLTLHGVDNIGLRVMSPVEFAEYSLLLSSEEIPRRARTLESIEEIFKILNEGKIEYFRNSVSFRDAKTIFSSLTLLRKLVTEEDERAGLVKALREGSFPEKNEALLSIYEAYISAMQSKGILDDVSFMRRALREGKKVDSEVVLLREFSLAPLERKLVEEKSAAKEKSIVELYPSEHFVAAYGAENEVENIIRNIYENRFPLDECLVVSANPDQYSILFNDMSLLYDIPMTFSTGLPVSLSTAASLFKAMLDLQKGFYGKDAWKALSSNDGFNSKKFREDTGIPDSDSDTFFELAGSLRLAFGDDGNNRRKLKDSEESLKANAAIDSKDRKNYEKKIAVIEPLRKLCSVLSCGFISFLKNYTVIRSGAAEFDSTALNRISEILETYERCSSGEADFSDILSDVLAIRICRKTADAGKLHFTDIRGALTSLRKNVFVCGLSASEFPGPVTQNYLALDEDINRIKEETVYTSEGRIRDNVRVLDSLSRLAFRNGLNVYYSYSSYDTAELKERNVSSWLWEKAGGEPEEKGFFQSGITPSFDTGLDFINGKVRRKTKEAIRLDNDFDRSGRSSHKKGWSPSAIETFFKCPRQFYLQYIAKIPNDSPDDPRVLIDSRDYGSLLHFVNANFSFRGNEKISKEEFLSEAGKAFDNFLKERPPVYISDIKEAKEEFLQTIGFSYDQNEKDYDVLVKESTLAASTDEGISIEGYPDRIASVEGVDDGYMVVDFKTSRKRNITYNGDADKSNEDKKSEKDIEKDYKQCLQVLIYAWLYNKVNNEDDVLVSGCEYRYPRLPEDRNPMPYGEKAEEFIEGKLKEFADVVLKEELSVDDFPKIKETDDNCRYCNLKPYCSWPGDKHIADEEGGEN